MRTIVNTPFIFSVLTLWLLGAQLVILMTPHSKFLVHTTVVGGGAKLVKTITRLPLTLRHIMISLFKAIGELGSPND